MGTFWQFITSENSASNQSKIDKLKLFDGIEIDS